MAVLAHHALLFLVAVLQVASNLQSQVGSTFDNAPQQSLRIATGFHTVVATPPVVFISRQRGRVSREAPVSSNSGQRSSLISAQCMTDNGSMLVPFMSNDIFKINRLQRSVELLV